MEKITSFRIDHDILEKRMYISKIDGDIITYNLKMVKPNCGAYLDDDGLHIFEHLFAAYIRNSVYGDAAIYTGSMGCRTGFYFLARDSISKAQAMQLVKNMMAFIAGSEGDIPDAQKSKGRGNYLNHDLAKAKAYTKAYGRVVKDWNEERPVYSQ